MTARLSHTPTPTAVHAQAGVLLLGGDRVATVLVYLSDGFGGGLLGREGHCHPIVSSNVV